MDATEVFRSALKGLSKRMREEELDGLGGEPETEVKSGPIKNDDGKVVGGFMKKTTTMGPEVVTNTTQADDDEGFLPPPKEEGEEESEPTMVEVEQSKMDRLREEFPKAYAAVFGEE